MYRAGMALDDEAIYDNHFAKVGPHDRAKNISLDNLESSFPQKK